MTKELSAFKNRALIRRLTETALLLALGTALSLIKFSFPFLFGGSITLFSSLPYVIIGYRFGVRWGVPAMLVGGGLQLLLGLQNLSYGATPLAVVAIIFLDYLLAFGVYGLAGVFRPLFEKRPQIGIALGALLTSLLRFGCHFLSGITVWAAFADIEPLWLYSLLYNGGYMWAEMLSTAILAFALSLVLDFSAANLRRRPVH